MLFNAIEWAASPELISLGPVTVRFYGLFFALAFVVGYKVMQYVYKKEGLPDTETDRVSMHMILGVVIGARLGHVLFYQPEEYLANPLDILKIWEGGLASHGAAIGILIAMYLYSRKPVIPSYMWIMDRIILTVPIGGFLVRMGNLMNSEIYGKPTTLPWGFNFIRDPEWHRNPVPRHPTQIYEGLGYLAIFAILFTYYKNRGRNVKPGSMFGLFLILLFGVRFLVEFFKEVQVQWEHDLVAATGLNQGQALSIPFIALGIFILIRAYRIAPGEKI